MCSSDLAFGEHGGAALQDADRAPGGGGLGIIDEERIDLLFPLIGRKERDRNQED